MKNQSRSRNQSHTHRNYKDVYDGYKLVELYDNDTLLVSFTWQPESVGGLDVPVSMTYAGNTYSYVTDGNKNVTALLDAAGFRVAGYTYGPFGQVLSMDGALAEVNPFRFSSEFHDDETGLVYYNYRYYSPSLGRWTKRDPIGEKGGVNKYAMTENDLLNNIDKNGLVGNSWGNAAFLPNEKDLTSQITESSCPNCFEHNARGETYTGVSLCRSKMSGILPLFHYWVEIDDYYDPQRKIYRTYGMGFYAVDVSNLPGVLLGLGHFQEEMEYIKRDDGNILEALLSGKKNCSPVYLDLCVYDLEKFRQYIIQAGGMSGAYALLSPQNRCDGRAKWLIKQAKRHAKIKKNYSNSFIFR